MHSDRKKFQSILIHFCLLGPLLDNYLLDNYLLVKSRDK